MRRALLPALLVGVPGLAGVAWASLRVGRWAFRTLFERFDNHDTAAPVLLAAPVGLVAGAATAVALGAVVAGAVALLSRAGKARP